MKKMTKIYNKRSKKHIDTGSVLLYNVKELMLMTHAECGGREYNESGKSKRKRIS